MRACVFVGAVIGIILTCHAAILRGDSGKETEAERIARLIKQLGDDAFAKREAASKELGAIGAPALAALRNAASSSHDLEIRRRAERISESIAARLAEAAAKAELAKLQGTWTLSSYEIGGRQVKGEDSEYTFTVTRNQFVLQEPGGKGRVEVGVLKIVQASKAPKAFDQVHAEGPVKGATILMIYEIDGDQLKFSWSDAKVRPTGFAANGDHRIGVQVYKRK